MPTGCAPISTRCSPSTDSRRRTWYTVEDAGDDRVHWCIHYELADRAALQAYVDGPAEAMRQEGLQRFEGQFTADRRILTPARPAATL